MKIKVARTALIYLRVSTEEQASEGYGLDSQKSACLELCTKRQWKVLEIFVDSGISGWKDVERPAFKRMMKRLKVERANLVFLDYSRFGRKTLPALTAFETLDDLGIFSIAATKPSIDCATAQGRTNRRDELSKAEDFSDQHSEETARRMKLAFEQGRWTRGAPIGYERAGTKVKGTANLIPKESEAKLIRQMFEMVGSGSHHPAEVLRLMTQQGLRSKRGNVLTISTFCRMLRSCFYIGGMKSKKWGIRPGLHGPIVSERVFKNVQLVLAGRKPVYAPYVMNREEFPLRRFLKCSECGSSLTGGPSRGKMGKLYNYYRCQMCKAVKSVPAERAEQQFLWLLERLKVSEAFVAEFEMSLRSEWSARKEDNTVMTPGLRAKLQNAQESQEKLVLAYVRGEESIVKVFDRVNTKLSEEIAEIEKRIADLDVERANFQQLSHFARHMLVDIASTWSQASIEQKQRVQNLLFPSGLSYHPENGILNPSNDSLFNQLEHFLGGKMDLVEAAGVEPASETTVNREHSCFSTFIFVSSSTLGTGEETLTTSLIDLVLSAQTEQSGPAYCATMSIRP